MKEGYKMNLHLKSFNIPEEILKWGESQPEHQRQHIGTHIDCYNLSCIDLPIEMEIQVIDVRDTPLIDLAAIRGISIQPNTFTIFRTGFLEKYGYGSEVYFDTTANPYLTKEVVDYLLEKKVKLIGIDLSGIQHGKAHVEIDKYIENNGAYVVENICNLDKIESKCFAALSWRQLENATAIKVEIDTI